MLYPETHDTFEAAHAVATEHNEGYDHSPYWVYEVAEDFEADPGYGGGSFRAGTFFVSDVANDIMWQCVGYSVPPFRVVA